MPVKQSWRVAASHLKLKKPKAKRGEKNLAKYAKGARHAYAQGVATEIRLSQSGKVRRKVTWAKASKRK
jgi:hypothetical protein